jgi:DNA-directed RNA polymerase beta subunit
MENLIDEIDSEFNKNTSLNVILNKEERYIELDLMRALDYLTHKNIESKFANIKKEKKEAEVEIELELKNKKLQAENNPGINPNPPSETTYLAKKTKRESNETKEKKKKKKKKKIKNKKKLRKAQKNKKEQNS